MVTGCAGPTGGGEDRSPHQHLEAGGDTNHLTHCQGTGTRLEPESLLRLSFSQRPKFKPRIILEVPSYLTFRNHRPLGVCPHAMQGCEVTFKGWLLLPRCDAWPQQSLGCPSGRGKCLDSGCPVSSMLTVLGQALPRPQACSAGPWGPREGGVGLVEATSGVRGGPSLGQPEDRQPQGRLCYTLSRDPHGACPGQLQTPQDVQVDGLLRSKAASILSPVTSCALSLSCSWGLGQGRGKAKAWAGRGVLPGQLSSSGCTCPRAQSRDSCSTIPWGDSSRRKRYG